MKVAPRAAAAGRLTLSATGEVHSTHGANDFEVRTRGSRRALEFERDRELEAEPTRLRASPRNKRAAGKR